MKTAKKVIIALFLGIVMVFGVVGCNAGVQDELQSKIDALQSQIAEMEAQIGERDEKIEQFEELIGKCVGTFYTLQEAYDNGWLTQADLQSIANYNNNGIPYPESLSDYIAKSIKKSWAKKEKEDNPATDITEEKVTICQYYGTYNDCVAVIVDEWGAQYIDIHAPYTVEIGSVIFNYNYPWPEIVVYKL